MVVVNLMGGLGNQLFQYATGRALAHRLKTPLLLDHTFLETDPEGKFTKRYFELDSFLINAKKADADDLRPFLKLRKTDFVSRVIKNVSGETPYIFFAENGFAYNYDFEKISKSVYLHGFWQSEKYFSSIRHILLRELTLEGELSETAKANKSKISSLENSVSIHFRRGDYVNLASAASYHGTTSLDYYNAAIAKMKKDISDPKFFIFSDDIAWVMENFALENAVYVSGLKSCEDLELMRACKNNIIANSSFSWWGAWLNTNPDKKVIAPKQWFKDEMINTKDLIPANWHKI